MFSLVRSFWLHTRAAGIMSAVVQAGRYLRGPGLPPLAAVDRRTLFASDVGQARLEEKQRSRNLQAAVSASQIEKSYPEVFEWEGRFLRFAYLPAKTTSRGLVVSFHGHDAHILLRPGKGMQDFDLLAPWDTFGWNRRGSWFWGEKGDNFVERMVQALIASHRRAGAPWFSMGASMGGFASLYHGIQYGAQGIYAMCPQVDLRLKIRQYAAVDPNNPYGYIEREGGFFPDLLGMAANKKTLPPVFIIQNLFDAVNPFADHAFRLLEIYNARKAWYGLRVFPAIGHGGDGSEHEAEWFFRLIEQKKPPHRFEGLTDSLASPA